MPFAVSQRSKPSTLTTIDSTTITATLVAINSRTRFMGFVLLCRALDRAGAVLFQDRPGALLRDDIGGSIGVSGGDSRENRGVDDTQAADAVHPQLVVHHRHGVASHLAGAHRVEDGGPQLSRRPGEICFGC